MLISLVIPTIGRKKELDELLLSIKEQKYKKIEVIIIDQNPTGYLNDIIVRHVS
ncbi:MAG: glycosyltransferase family 2 protein [Fusobacteriaceae bacterium]